MAELVGYTLNMLFERAEFIGGHFKYHEFARGESARVVKLVAPGYTEYWHWAGEDEYGNPLYSFAKRDDDGQDGDRE